MTKRKSKGRNRSARVNPIAIFGSPPIIPGEDSSAYDEILLRATSALKPADIIEEMFLDDIVRPTWDIIRFRRLENSLLNSAAHEGLKRILIPLVVSPNSPSTNSINRQMLIDTYAWKADELAWGWRAQDPDACQEVASILSKAGISMDEVMAEALSTKIAEIMAIDSLIGTAEDRRYAALRELDRRRTTFAQSVRRFTHDLEGAEVKVLNGDDSHETAKDSKPAEVDALDPSRSKAATEATA